MRPEEILEMIEEEKERFPPDLVYYGLRKFGLRRINKTQITLIRYILALKKLGIPITVHVVSYLLKRNPTIVLDRLHRLGDRGIIGIILGSEKSGRYIWFVSEHFLNFLREFGVEI